MAGILLPVLLLFRFSLNQFVPGKFMVEALTAANYVKFATDPFYVAVLVRTLRVALVCTVICLLLGFPMAYWLARTGSRYKNLLLILVVLPLFVGNAVRAAGWMVVFGTKGVVNSLLAGLGLVSAPLTLMYTEGAVIVGIVAINLPFVVLTLQSVIEGVDRSIEEAALSLGAGPFTTFRRALLPLAMPGVVAGGILCFILAMNAYATPVLLGGPRFQVMGPLVYRTFVGQSNWPFGAALAFVLMTATLVLSIASNVIVQRRYRR
ncbi:MAG TPA: ABC transporter permease [Methylomirabilota bacterium]|nr:ABC transporter permease [Methylomirabilota bacterium]